MAIRPEKFEDLDPHELLQESWDNGSPMPVSEIYSRSKHSKARMATETLLDLIYAEVCLREEHELNVNISDYLSEFPFCSDEIRKLFDVHSAMKRDFSLGCSLAELSEFSSFDERYQFVREVGVGGLGRVLLHFDSRLGRHIAVKKLLPEHAQDRHHCQRFHREATLTASLQHPGIVPVYDLGKDHDGDVYYTMKYVEGESLEEITRSRKSQGLRWCENTLELNRLVNRFVRVCQAMGYAHDRGILHRDIKPSNILIGSREETLVVDWGVAGYSQSGQVSLTNGETIVETNEARSTLGTVESNPTDRLPLTRADMRLGTPEFMSPEQLTDPTQATVQSDVFSLGATLHYVLHGCSHMKRQSHFEPPKALTAICAKAMEADLDVRYGGVNSLLQDLESWLADEPCSAYKEPMTQTVRRWGRQHQYLMLTACLTCLAGFAAIMVFLVQEIRVQRGLAEKLMMTEMVQRGQELTSAVASAELASFDNFVVFRNLPLSQDRIELCRSMCEHYRQMTQVSDPAIQLQLAICHLHQEEYLESKEILEALRLRVQADENAAAMNAKLALLLAEIAFREEDYERVIELSDDASEQIGQWSGCNVFVQGLIVTRMFALYELNRARECQELAYLLQNQFCELEPTMDRDGEAQMCLAMRISFLQWRLDTQNVGISSVFFGLFGAMGATNEARDGYLLPLQQLAGMP